MGPFYEKSSENIGPLGEFINKPEKLQSWTEKKLKNRMLKDKPILKIITLGN